jgi:UDP-3-O-[3-hydroxymyristoyl] glucosamine N-acyltransferase
MDMSLQEIAQLIGAEVEGDAATRISGLNGIKEAAEGDLTFYADRRYHKYLDKSPAAAFIVDRDFESNSRPLLRVDDPKVAFIVLLKQLEERLVAHPSGIHPTAVVAPTATLGKDVSLDAHVVVADGARIDDGAILYPGVYIGRDSTVGRSTVIYPNASVRERVQIGAYCTVFQNAAIGSDGFGFAGLGDQRLKIPHIGGVIIGDDVEIGACAQVDRGTTGNTVIGNGSKIDNLVYVAHNVSIGENCAISGGTVIGGSTKIGDNVLMGGQCAIKDHSEIGAGTFIAARTGIHGTISPGSMVSSAISQRDVGAWRKIQAALDYLPNLLRRFRKLEKRVDALEK